MSEQPRAAPARVVAAVGAGDPSDPASWSGTPAAITEALGRLGVAVTPVRTSFSHGERILSLLYGLPRASGVRRTYGGLSLRGLVHTGDIASPLRRLRSRRVRVRSEGIAADAALYFGASSLSVPQNSELVVIEDMTIGQVVRLGGNFHDWDAFPDRYRERRAEKQAKQLRAATVAAFLTSWAAEAAIAEYGLDPARVVVLGVGSRFSPTDRPRDWSTPKFLFVGLDWERKRGGAVVEAFAEVRKTHPEAELHLVGKHPAIDAPGVVLHGQLSRTEPVQGERLRTLFEQSTCFVLPSRLEPAGIALAEACAHGVPCIATTLGGGMDIVGDAGLGVDPDDDRALVDAMLELADPVRAKALGAVALRRAQMLTWDAVAERLAAAAGWWEGSPIKLTPNTPSAVVREAAQPVAPRHGATVPVERPPVLGGTRIFPVLRASHLEDLDAEVPRRTFFFGTSFDMGDVELPPHVEQVSVLTLRRRLRSIDGPSVELWEPLWVRELPRWLAVALILRLRRRAERRRISFYAIENNDLGILLYGRRTIPRVADRLVRWVLRQIVSGVVDAVAYGSAGAAATYAELVDPKRVKTAIIEEVLAPVRTEPVDGDGAADGEPRSRTAVFLGVLEGRKGLGPLMRAWERVEEELPDAQLVIAGQGPLALEVQEWGAGRPEQRRSLGLLARRDALAELDGASVLVAPSVPDGRWREQIGFPIQEGLARGLTIVTTEQTGLADMLRDGGHTVLDHRRLDELLAEALVRALRVPLPPATVVAALPSQNGRVVADRWLHADDRPAP